MAQISIRERFFPFSHTPGVSVLYPGSSLCFEIYPTLILYRDLEGGGEGKIELPVIGPVKEFTVLLDLERGGILVFGKDQKGFFRFHCRREGDSLYWIQEKGGTERWNLPAPKILFAPPRPEERLCVVSKRHRSWERLVEEGDFVAVLAILYRFLAWYEPLEVSFEGDFRDLILGGFEGLLVPVGKDTKFRGFSFDFKNPIAFLRALRFILTSLFVSKEADEIHFCMNLPKELPCGRIKGLSIDGALMDMEWRKGFLRRLSVDVKEKKSLHIKAKGLNSARLKMKRFPLSDALPLEPANHFIDRFEKA